LLIPVTNKHTTIKKMTVKTVKSPWTDEELKNGMVERVWQPNILANVIENLEIVTNLNEPFQDRELPPTLSQMLIYAYYY
jgi:hypothetical protein